MTNLDPNNFQDCVSRAMLMISNRKMQMAEEGYEWPINTASCRWSVEQAIINRKHGETMMSAAIRYVESVEYRAEEFNGIPQ